MIKIIITAFIWISCFLVLLPSDKPTWMGVVAGFASYQVMTYFIYELYEIILALLDVIQKNIDGKDK